MREFCQPLVAKTAPKLAKLKAIANDESVDETERLIARLKMAELPRTLNGKIDRKALPKTKDCYPSYQLIRNVLAAQANDCAFCVLCDARRPDLLQAWYEIMRCVLAVELRLRCKVLTWQELSGALPAR